MALLFLLMMLSACAATPQDLSGKMFNFPEETDTSYVKIIPSRQNFSAASVCLRFFTGLSRGFSLFSMASKSHYNEIMFLSLTNKFLVYMRDQIKDFERLDVKLNTWHSICSTWDPDFDLAELWFDGMPSNRRSVKFGSIIGPIIITIGQEQDSYGGGFSISQSFVGNMADVHMWDYALSPCEIRGYISHTDFTSGNVLNWRALKFQIHGNVKIQSKIR